MTDDNDIMQRRGVWAQCSGWVLSHWRKIAVMVLLGAVLAWGTLFVARHKGPGLAQAHPKKVSQVRRPAGERVEISYVDLLRIPGRHDRIANDFFMRESEIEPIGLPESQDDAAPVAVAGPTPISADAPAADTRSTLYLKAIIMGECPKAFINDELVSLGDILTVDGAAKRRYKVVAIDEDSVVLMCGAVKTELRLMTEEK